MKVLISGTSKGIGKAIALLFLKKGHEVIGLDILKGLIQVKYPDEKFETIKKEDVIESRTHKQANDDESLRGLE